VPFAARWQSSGCCLTGAPLALRLQVYALVWQAAPETRNALEKLRATWHGVFADAVLAAVARASQARPAGPARRTGAPAAGAARRGAPLTPLRCRRQAAAAQMQAAQQPQPAQYAPPAWQAQPAALQPGAYAQQGPPQGYGQPALMPPLPVQGPAPGQQHPGYAQPAAGQYGGQAAPLSPGRAYAPPQSPGYAPVNAPPNGVYYAQPPQMQPQPQQQPQPLLQPQPQLAPAPVMYAVPQQPPPMQAQPAPVLQPPVQYVQQPLQPQPVVQYQAPLPVQLLAPVQLPAPVTLPPPVTLQPPAGPRPAPVTLPAPGPAPAHLRAGGGQGPSAGAPGAPGAGLPDFLSSLLQQGLIRVPGGSGAARDGAGGAAAAADGNESDDDAIPRRRYDPEKLHFRPERIKVRCHASLPIFLCSVDRHNSWQRWKALRRRCSAEQAPAALRSTPCSSQRAGHGAVISHPARLQPLRCSAPPSLAAARGDDFSNMQNQLQGRSQRRGYQPVGKR